MRNQVVRESSSGGCGLRDDGTVVCRSEAIAQLSGNSWPDAQ